MKHWVIDTWVIEKCNPIDNECIDCVRFLIGVLDYGAICLDNEGEIMKEYSCHIKSHSFISKWWDRIVREKGHLCFFSGKLAAKHIEHLLDNLHFDPADIKFVGVASKTNDRLLASGDSDYDEEVCGYLHTQLGIAVISPEKAIPI